jgi:hypothetical protein
MAFSSFNAKLMYDASSTATPDWQQVCPIKTIPQIGGPPEQLETTTLDDEIQTFVDGIQQQESMTITINADKTMRATLKTLKNVDKKYSFWLGNDGLGSEGKFTGNAKLSYYINEAGVNAIVEMTITLTPTTPFEEEAGV